MMLVADVRDVSVCVAVADASRQQDIGGKKFIVLLLRCTGFLTQAFEAGALAAPQGAERAVVRNRYRLTNVRIRREVVGPDIQLVVWVGRNPAVFFTDFDRPQQADALSK
jgi:hypothetical protein